METEEPHIVRADNMGEPTTYWRQFRHTSDGCCVIGTGHTKQQAMDDAEKNFIAYEAFLSLPDVHRLDAIVAQPMHDKERDIAIRILAKLIMEMRETLLSITARV